MAVFNNSFFKVILLVFLIVCTENHAQNFKKIQTLSKLNSAIENNGIAVADYDNDYDLDVFVVAKASDEEGKEKSRSKLFRNKGNGTFEDVTIEAGLDNLFPSSENSLVSDALDGVKYGVAWGDYDNDGFADIFFTHSYKVQLFRNLGDGTFEETTLESGITKTSNCINTGATWFDANNDGFLDLYISVWDGCLNNILYLNNGDNTFRDVSESYGVNSSGISYMSVPFDFNSDGWMDLYVTNDFQVANEAFINQNGTSFTESATQFGLESAVNDMGVGINDYNNDGFFDFFITGINENILLTNKGDNTFEDLAFEKNVKDTGWAWDVIFSDFDLDGDEDIFITNGFKLSGPTKQRNAYFKNLNNEGVDNFVDFTNGVGLRDETISVGATPFDYDNDGDLDLFVSNSDRTSFFYENRIIDEDSSVPKKWAKIILEGTISNRNAVGTMVSLTTDLGKIHRYYTGVGFLSQSIQPVHFGLGEANEILEVKIKWPSGLEETHTNLPNNTTILAKENNGFEILDLPKALKITGCTDPNSCNYNPDAVINDDSCAYLESKTIVGNTNPEYLGIETYTYSTSNNTLSWHVDGGEVIEKGENSITVNWGVSPLGSVSVVESNLECSTEEIKLEISLLNSSSHSIARIWNEALLEAIRNDYARPTVHARNLFHVAVAMYDAWAIYNQTGKTYLIGNADHEYENPIVEFISNKEINESMDITISYAAYRLLKHRFEKSPNALETVELIEAIMNNLGYDLSFDSANYTDGNPAALGNYIAETIINYGYTDNSRETEGYSNAFYRAVNKFLAPLTPGNETTIDPNRWQPLSLRQFIDQSGNVINGSIPMFLSPEWGAVKPFSLNANTSRVLSRDNNEYTVYHDPEGPPLLNLNMDDSSSESYKWGFSLVSIWGSHLDPSDGVLWNISPNAIGNYNISKIPQNFEDYGSFYKTELGGDISPGHNINPYTGLPYEDQFVPRGDYSRVLAEFWADGPDSETPPGHWFTLLNYVSDHPLLEKKLNGAGEVLDDLEWDVKSYFLMGGTMHDAAITAWSIKGWYDYIRPISAIRYMAELGQSTDMAADNYNVAGIPLKENFIEVVKSGDPLAGRTNEHLGKIKLYTWRGHSYINDTETDNAGVGWILAENWWPYQRPSFVTPPFAGYVSGHSTYSRAAAEVMTLLTGDEFFPGGYGEFVAKKNEFLVFEEGPSVDVKLQWATYRDASDQCSLSRIWGGIHPPADDIPGRLIGEQIGVDAFNFGVEYFKNQKSNNTSNQEHIVYPNPIINNEIKISNTNENDVFELVDMKGSKILIMDIYYNERLGVTQLKISNDLASGIYVLKINNQSALVVKK